MSIGLSAVPSFDRLRTNGIGGCGVSKIEGLINKKSVRPEPVEEWMPIPAASEDSQIINWLINIPDKTLLPNATRSSSLNKLNK